MSQEFLQTEGIVLRVIPFRDNDQIVAVFTQQGGMIKLFCKGGGRKKRYSPLTKVEVIYRERRGEIFGCQEMHVIDSFAFLRKELMHLEVACDLLKVILSSQLEGKASPLLYTLLCFYLNKIPQAPDPWVLAASFRLKLLRHDGLIAIPFNCSECGQLLLHHAYTREAESWCEHHHLAASQKWEQQELENMYQWAMCQQFKDLCMSQISSEMQNKIAYFFEACCKKVC